MKYCIVSIQGKQYKVAPGDQLLVDKLDLNPGEELNLDKVLLQVTDTDVVVGTPVLEKVVLKAKILDHVKADKIRVATYKAKSRLRKVKGHRQQMTKIEIVAQPKAKAKTAKKTA